MKTIVRESAPTSACPEDFSRRRRRVRSSGPPIAVENAIFYGPPSALSITTERLIGYRLVYKKPCQKRSFIASTRQLPLNGHRSGSGPSHCYLYV